MITFFKQFVAYLKPIKGHGTIGMFQRTIVYSEWVLIFSVVVSISLECLNKSHEGWIQFFENYAIGTACSVVIVLVTTITQFISERNKEFDVFYNSVIVLFLYFEEASRAKENEYQNTLSKLLDLIKEEADTCSKPLKSLFWFKTRIENEYKMVAIKLKILLNKQKTYSKMDDLYVSVEEIQDCRREITAFIRLLKLDNYHFLNYLEEKYENEKDGDNDQL